jgi:hypothetical protein
VSAAISSAPVFLGFALHCRASRIFHLEPSWEHPRAVGRVLSLRNDSFEPHLAGVGEDGRAVVLGVLVGTDAGASLGQHACKRGFADLKRIAPTLDQPQFNGNKRSASDFLPCDPQNDELSESFMTEVSIRKRFGVVADEQQRAMSGLEFVQGLVDGTLPLNSMAQTLGYNIVEVSKGRVVAAAEPHAGHLNPAGTVHGGLAATLLDSCMGLAIRSMLDRGLCANDARVQDFACSADHCPDWLGEG